MAVASLVAKVEAQVATFQKQFAEASRTAQKFEKDFANTASSVTAQQKRISDAFAAFSGDRLAREASALAKAVEQIGGASKLTAGEQARVNATMTEAIAKYAALGQQAPKAMLDLAAATAKVPQQLSLADKAMGALSGTFGQFTAAGLASSALSSLASGVAAFAAEGKRLPGLQSSFDSLAAGVKQNSGEMLNALQKGSAGLVTDVNLMQSANKALLLGLPATSQGLGELAETARILGKAMGQDATKSLDDLITALGRSSPLILDNLGLTVKVEEANQKYAATLGKTADQLTDAEKKTAFFTEAMAKARAKTKELGDETRTLSERATQLSVSLGNVITGTVGGLDQALGRATSSGRNFTQFLQDVIQHGVGVALAMQSAGSAVDEFIRKQRQQRAGPVISPGALARESAVYREELEASTRAFEDSKQAALNHARAIAQLREELIGGGAIRAALDMVEALKGLPPVHTLTRDAQDRVNQAMNQALEVYRAQGREAPDAMRRIAAATFDLSTLAPKIEGSIASALASIGNQAHLSIPKVLDLYAVIRDGMPKVMMGADGLKLPRVEVPNIKLPQTFWQQVFKPSDIGTALGMAISGAIQGGGNVFQAAAGGIGQQLTSGLAGFLTKARTDESGNPLKPLLTGWLGGAVSAALPAVGALVGPLVGKITSALKEAFGGPSKAELLGRQVVDQFEDVLSNTLTAAQKLANGNEEWKNVTVAVSQAYVAAGRSAAEAEAAVKKLWDSSKGGADKARLAVLEIQAVMDIAADKQKGMGDAIASQAQETDAATLALTEKIKGLGAQYDSLFNSIKNEAPEEEMGVLERRTRDAMAAIEQEVKAVSRDGFGRMGDAAEDAMRAIEEAFRDSQIKIPIEFVLPDGVRIPATSGGAQKTLQFPSDSVQAPARVSSGGASPTMAPIIVQTFWDGRQVAESFAPHLPRVVRRRVGV